MDKTDDARIDLKVRADAALEWLSMWDDITPGVALIQKYLIEALNYLDTDSEIAHKWFNLAVWCLREHLDQEMNAL